MKMFFVLLPFLFSPFALAAEDAPSGGKKILGFAGAVGMEKSFVLEALTAYEGGDNGRHPAFSLANAGRDGRTFCVSLKKCRRGGCEKRGMQTAKFAARFVEDYNRIYGAPFLAFRRECMPAHIKLYPRAVRIVLGNNRARWFCNGISGDGEPRNCFAEFGAASDSAIGRTVAHEILNITGINDTRNPLFRNCLVYDSPDNTLRHYAELCDIEKRLIIFQRDYIKNGMDRNETAAAFRAHWQTSDFTLALAKLPPPPAPKKQKTKQFPTSGNR
ncbi:MAG: hypothetical protein ACR2P5_03995 [Gammaproteobacteria bacterium]